MGAAEITIGITCFNAEDTIERAIKSALGQTIAPVEIIVLDDNSNDRSWEILCQLAENHQLLRLIRNRKNRGVAAGRNRIIEEAKGGFVAYFDDDDESVPWRIEMQLERLLDYERQHKTSRVICFGGRKVKKQSGHVGYVPGIGQSPPEPCGEIVADSLLCLLTPRPFEWGECGTCVMFARRETIRDIGGFDESFRRMAEWDLAVRFAQKGGHFVSVNSEVITQYVTAGPDKAGRIPLEYALRLRKKHKSYLRRKRLYGLSVLAAYIRFYYARGNKLRYRVLGVCAMFLFPRTFGRQILSKKIAR